MHFSVKNYLWPETGIGEGLNRHSTTGGYVECSGLKIQQRCSIISTTPHLAP